MRELRSLNVNMAEKKGYFFGKLTLSARNLVVPRERLAKNESLDAFGTVEITVEEAGHPDITKILLVAHVEGNEELLKIGETTSFPISDPMSDIMIHAKDDLGLRRSHAKGRI